MKEESTLSSFFVPVRKIREHPYKTSLQNILTVGCEHNRRSGRPPTLCPDSRSIRSKSILRLCTDKPGTRIGLLLICTTAKNGPEGNRADCQDGKNQNNRPANGFLIPIFHRILPHHNLLSKLLILYTGFGFLFKAAL